MIEARARNDDIFDRRVVLLQLLGNSIEELGVRELVISFLV